MSVVLNVPSSECGFIWNVQIYINYMHAVILLVEALCYKPEGRGFESRWGHWIFQAIESFQPHFDPVVDSASNRKEYQESTWGGG
jgi:hypothetical protein